jgi:hypothetical protein
VIVLDDEDVKDKSCKQDMDKAAIKFKVYIPSLYFMSQHLCAMYFVSPYAYTKKSDQKCSFILEFLQMTYKLRNDKMCENQENIKEASQPKL